MVIRLICERQWFASGLLWGDAKEVPFPVRTWEGVFSVYLMITDPVQVLENCPRICPHAARTMALARPREKLRAWMQQYGLRWDHFRPRLETVMSVQGIQESLSSPLGYPFGVRLSQVAPDLSEKWTNTVPGSTTTSCT